LPLWAHIQADVIHRLHGGASFGVSESASPLSSAFVHQALLLHRPIHSNFPVEGDLRTTRTDRLTGLSPSLARQPPFFSWNRRNWSLGTHPVSTSWCATVTSLLLHVVIEPSQHRLVPELAVLRLQTPVPFVGEIKQLGFDATPLQCREQLEGLAFGHAEVAPALHQQHGRFNILNKARGRPFLA